MAEQGDGFEEHVLTELHELLKLVRKLDAELEEFRPLLAMFRPGNGTSDLQRAGLVRTLRRARRDGGPTG